jgi:hypothetical protein
MVLLEKSQTFSWSRRSPVSQGSLLAPVMSQMNPVSIVIPDFKIYFNVMLFSHGELIVKVGCEKVDFDVALDVM